LRAAAVSVELGLAIIAVLHLVALIALFVNSRRVKRVLDVAIQVDAAVNGKPAGASTISDDVTEATAVLPIVKEIKKTVGEIEKRV
jgi:uncharacterized membrane protein YqiK